MKNQSGRTMLEIICVLSIISVLSLGGMWGYNYAMTTHYINEIIDAIHFRSVAISNATREKKFDTAEKMNEFLAHFDTQIGPYKLSFKAPSDENPFEGKSFSSEITGKNGQSVRGKVCYRLMKAMIDEKIVSDVGITVNDDEDEDGQEETVTMRLNGLAIDLDAVCGDDSL